MFSLLKSAATSTVAKTKNAVTGLAKPPTQISCGQCDKPVMIPPDTWGWACPACGEGDHRSSYDATKCTRCGAAQPSELAAAHEKHVDAMGGPRIVACTMCGHPNDVASTKAYKLLGSLASGTKKLAIKAKDATVSEVQHLRSKAATFKCEHCRSELANPNYTEEDAKREARRKSRGKKETKEEEEEAAASHVVTLEDQHNANQSPSAADLYGDEAAAAPLPSTSPDTPAHAVVCPTCHRQTRVPGSNFTASLSSATDTVRRKTTSVYHAVAGKHSVKCPVCGAPCKVPSLSEGADDAAYAVETHGSAPVGHLADRTKAGTVVDIRCPSCSIKFPARARA